MDTTRTPFKLAALSIVTAAVLMTAGCGPRGETKNVDQVLNDSRDYYTDVAGDVQAQHGAAELKSLEGILVKLTDRARSNPAGTFDARQDAKQATDLLATLISHAGYTSRPAMTELMDQFRGVSNSESTSSAVVRLLVARTYRNLGSELEATKFAL